MSESERYVAWVNRGGLQGVWGGGLFTFILPFAVYGAGYHPPFPSILLLPIGTVVGYAVGKAIGWTLLTGAGNAAQAFTFPATTGFYVHEHSEIDTLEVRGDFKGAVSAWEAVAIAEPGNPWPLVRSGDLYARKLGDPALAVERYRLARSIPGVKPEIERYASQKIIDLLLGPLDDRGGAMVELRMLIDRYPSSREATGAREALRSLKAV
ncbi:MAG TPA: hypothetical protein VF368_11005 [Gemmatimonadaceae bacterium]|jgi:hypothetical protein